MKSLRLAMCVAVAGALTCGLFAGRSPAVHAQAATGRIRVVHMAAESQGVDVLVDGKRTVPQLTFRSASAYATVAVGAHTMQLTPVGTAADALLSTNLNVQAGQDETVVALGLSSAVSALVLPDDNQPPAAGKAKVRFVHAGADVPAVDIAVAGGPVLFHDVAFQGVAGPLEVAAGTHRLDVRAAGTTTVVLSLPSVVLQAGQIVTFFGAGLRKDNSLTVVQLAYAAAGTPGIGAPVGAAVGSVPVLVGVARMPQTGTGGLADPGQAAHRWALLGLGLLVLGASCVLFGKGRRI